jgi:anthranilate/para-aminobenzoate synthase component II
MRILILDLDGSAPAITDFLDKTDVQTVTTNFSQVVEQTGIGLVIIGSYANDTSVTDLFDQELYERIVQTTAPVIGIGSGFEVICRAFGNNVEDIGDLDDGETRLVPTEAGSKMFQGSDPLLINPSRRWLIDELPKSLQVLARSQSGIEAIRHKQKPVYAIQQLPENFTYASDAKLVFANLCTPLQA